MHRRGQLHGNADILSTRPCKTDCKECKNIEKQIIVKYKRIAQAAENWEANSLKREQEKGDDIGPIEVAKEIGY